MLRARSLWVQEAECTELVWAKKLKLCWLGSAELRLGVKRKEEEEEEEEKTPALGREEKQDWERRGWGGEAGELGEPGTSTL